MDHEVNRLFQYAAAVTLNDEEIRKYFERISKIKLSINRYNWEGINLSTEKGDWKKTEKYNLAISLNILYNEKKIIIYPAYVSKYNLNCEKQVILLMIPNGEG